MSYTINKIAQTAGVTLRTLRYYDRIGLLVPSGRTEAGYRLYSDEDIERLQQILFFRELDFSLDKIDQLLRDPVFDRKEALKMQIRFLEKRAERYLNLTELAKETLRNLEGGKKVDKNEMFKAFDYDKMMEEQKQYEDEVKERWGSTEAYRISKELTSKYSREDWERINAESEENLKEMINCFTSGIPCDDSRMMAVCDKARAHMSKYFYPCSLEMYSGLGNMYIADERFTAYYDKFASGLAAYYNEAIQHYCITRA
ncbi:MAG TPA: MerR family transcriptional regulator [Clostridia bacterium]|nr:MerR family transcriptional regulator [Clostridia bacterium]